MVYNKWFTNGRKSEVIVVDNLRARFLKSIFFSYTYNHRVFLYLVF